MPRDNVLSAGAATAVLGSVLPYLVVIGYRIHIEEAVLQETFGLAYAQYARTT